MIEINVNTDGLTIDECDALATFFHTLGGKPQGLSVSSANESRDLSVSSPISVSDTGVEPEQMGDDLPDLSEDEPKELIEQQGELDSNGLPWDKRIHSGTPTKNKDGSWKKRKGVDDETFNTVVAELKGEVAEQPVQEQPRDPSTVGFTSQQVQQSNQLAWPDVLKRMSDAKTQPDTIAQGMVAVGLVGQPFPSLVNHPELYEAFLNAIGA